MTISGKPLPVSMAKVAEAILNRCAEGVNDPDFTTFVYEGARGEPRPLQDTDILTGSLMLTQSEIEACERSPRPDGAYDSLVRVKLMNLADGFQRQIWKALIGTRPGWQFKTYGQPVSFPRKEGEASPSVWYLAVYWTPPKEKEDAGTEM